MVSHTKIKQLIELLKEHDLGEIHVQYDEKSQVTIKSKTYQTVAPTPPSFTQSTNQSETPQKQSSSPDEKTFPNATVVKSPMVGTVYLTPTPEQPAFVKTNQAVQIGETLCLIEAMKMFNKITSEHSGTIVKILVENGETVEYDQPLFLIQEA